MATEVRMPQLGLTMEEGTITKWVKVEGDNVKVGDVIVEITTDKLTNEIESEVDGVVLKTYAEVGEDIPVKGVLCVIGEAGETIEETIVDSKSKDTKIAENAKKEKVVVTSQEKDSNEKESRRIKISPLAKKTAKKMDVDYTNLTGSGPGGRIVQSDIINASEEDKKESAALKIQNKHERQNIETGKIALMEGDTVERIAGMRKVVAERMYRAYSEIPSVTQTMKIDVTNLIEFRKMINKDRADRLSINDFILKAVAKTLKDHSRVLVSYDGEQMIKRAHVNLGMAVALEEGLIVPVIMDADKLSISELSSVSKDLAKRAREGTLGMDEYNGSTFTVSNLGMYGVESFTPIINQPDGAILGVCEIQSELDMDDEGNIFKKQVMRVSMTFDHRLIDGAIAAKFKLALKELLENPMEIVL